MSALGYLSWTPEIDTCCYGLQGYGCTFNCLSVFTGPTPFHSPSQQHQSTEGTVVQQTVEQFCSVLFLSRPRSEG